MARDSLRRGARGFLTAAEQSGAKAAVLRCRALSLPVLRAAQPGRREDLAPALSAGSTFAACAGGALAGGGACDAQTFSYCRGPSEVGFSWERRCWPGPNRGAVGLFLVQGASCNPFSILDGPRHVGASPRASLLWLFLPFTTIRLLRAGACGHCPDQRATRQRRRVSRRAAKGDSSLHGEWLSPSQSQPRGSGVTPRQLADRDAALSAGFARPSLQFPTQSPRVCIFSLVNCCS